MNGTTLGTGGAAAGVGVSCCVFALLFMVGAIISTIVAVTDLTGGRTHLVLDIVLLAVFWLGFVKSTLAGIVAAIF